METVATRPAKIEDLKTLLEFEQGIIEAEKPLYPFLKTGQLFQSNIKGLIIAEHTHLIVAVKKYEIIGSGNVRIENSSQFHKNKKTVI